MSKVVWVVGGYALALVVGGLVWLILRATGEPADRAAVIAAILVLAIFSLGLAAMYSWLTVVRSEPADRPYGAFLAFVRILQTSPVSDTAGRASRASGS